MKDVIQTLCQQALHQFCQDQKIQLPVDFSYPIQSPKEKKFGDFSVSIAFKLAETLKTPPRQAAQLLLPFLNRAIEENKEFKSSIEKIEIAGGGYLNFFVKAEALASIVLEIKKQDANFGKTEFGKKEKVLVEFVSANPTGPLTIAHGRQACVGDALVQMLKTAGFQAESEY